MTIPFSRAWPSTILRAWRITVWIEVGTSVHRHRPGEFEELGDDAVQPVHLADHRLGGLAVVGVVPVALPEIGGEPLDRAERVADLMGDAGGEASQGGQPLAPGDLLLEAPHLRHVPKEDDIAEKGAVILWSVVAITSSGIVRPSASVQSISRSMIRRSR